MSDQKKLVEVVTPGVTLKDLKFAHKCDTCDCEFKCCLDALGQPKNDIPCPDCGEVCAVDIGKYGKLLLRRKPLPAVVVTPPEEVKPAAAPPS